MARPGRTALLALCLWTAALAAGCFAPRRVVHHYNIQPVPAKAIIKAAVSQLGKPYAYGGQDPHMGFDCSGLVYWCYGVYGSLIPRTAHEQFRMGAPVAKSQLRAGDLVFFDTASGPDKPGHVGIMISHERFIHSPGSGETVREDELANNYWKKTYYGARRVD